MVKRVDPFKKKWAELCVGPKTVSGHIDRASRHLEKEFILPISTGVCPHKQLIEAWSVGGKSMECRWEKHGVWVGVRHEVWMGKAKCAIRSC